MTERLGLGRDSLVVELASNDGYLLQHFLPKGLPVLGIEPALNVAEAAVERGVETVSSSSAPSSDASSPRSAAAPISCSATTSSRRSPTSTTSSAGVAALLAPGGTATFEFPHLAKLDRATSSTTRSTTSTSRTSRSTRSARSSAPQGLDLVDVEELPSHGGSLRVFLRHARRAPAVARPSPSSSTARTPQGCATPRRTAGSPTACEESKRALLELLIGLRARRASRSSATAPRARATRCSTTAGSGPTSSTTRSTGTRTSREAHAGNAHPDPCARADRRDEARM